MKILMIGGTGLLGSQAARELIARGHDVRSIALPPLPEGALLPPEMELTLGNINDMTDGELEAQFRGMEGFIFAAGVDERIEGPSPIYDFFKKYNITPLERLLRIAKRSGVKHAVIAGSYFTHFAKTHPELELTKWHPYIRSRVDQENMALSFASDTFDVSVLELPYIFGAQKGRKPVWVFLVEMLRGMKSAAFYPRGGTAMVTVRQVGQAFSGALETNRGGTAYPIGWFNLTWKELLAIMYRYMGEPKKKIVTIPDWMFALSAKKIDRTRRKAGTEGGLLMRKFTAMQTSELFIDRSLGSWQLGVTDDDIDAAIGESVRLSLEVLEKKTSVIDMKGE
ncbi:MAG TPA: NAD-dependent epimerase/dehydratase family protein [Eubacteriales bacterium]|nr:NAD-dependent epimerase/dehydratase family protein [Eubacteriales bacterium]